LGKISSINSQMAVTPKITAEEIKSLAADLRKQLDAIQVDLEPHAADPEHLNLRRPDLVGRSGSKLQRTSYPSPGGVDRRLRKPVEEGAVGSEYGGGESAAHLE
jgi:hypothetical protein